MLRIAAFALAIVSSFFAQSCLPVATALPGFRFDSTDVPNVIGDSQSLWTFATRTNQTERFVESRDQLGVLQWRQSIGTILIDRAIASGGTLFLFTVSPGFLTVRTFSASGATVTNTTSIPSYTWGLFLSIPTATPNGCAIAVNTQLNTGSQASHNVRVLEVAPSAAISIYREFTLVTLDGPPVGEIIMDASNEYVFSGVTGGLFNRGGLARIPTQGPIVWLYHSTPTSQLFGPLWKSSTGIIKVMSYESGATFMIREITLSIGGSVQVGGIESGGAPGSTWLGGAAAVDIQGSPEKVLLNSQGAYIRTGPNAYSTLFTPNGITNIGAVGAGAFGYVFFCGTNVLQTSLLCRYDPTTVTATAWNLGGEFSSSPYAASLITDPPVLGTAPAMSVTGASPASTGIILFSFGMPASTSFGAAVVHVDYVNPSGVSTFQTDALGTNTQWLQMPYSDPGFAGLLLTFQAVVYQPNGAFELTNGVRLTLGF